MAYVSTRGEPSSNILFGIRLTPRKLRPVVLDWTNTDKNLFVLAFSEKMDIPSVLLLHTWYISPVINGFFLILV